MALWQDSETHKIRSFNLSTQNRNTSSKQYLLPNSYIEMKAEDHQIFLEISKQKREVVLIIYGCNKTLY